MPVTLKLKLLAEEGFVEVLSKQHTKLLFVGLAIVKILALSFRCSHFFLTESVLLFCEKMNIRVPCG